MRVLIVHNRYQLRGGEDSVVEAEAQLLAENGHPVELLFADNRDIVRMRDIEVVASTFWNQQFSRKAAQLVGRFRPDIVHVHNTFPLASPTVFRATASVATVQTLHNFRYLCPQGVLLRNEQPCVDCVGHFPWRGIYRGCYRDSVAQTAVLAGANAFHKALGTFTRSPSIYIALSRFCRDKLVEGGFAPDRIMIKPNFVDVANSYDVAREGFLFVGRLSVEKGVTGLAPAFVAVQDASLRVAGDGPMVGALTGLSNVTLLGSVDSNAVLREMAKASALVIPSICYEGFPRVLVEAYASSLPVIASRLGSLEELVIDGHTGLLFDPGSSSDLAAKLRWAKDNPERMREMGRNARLLYEERFTGAANYARMIEIYGEARRRYLMGCA